MEIRTPGLNGGNSLSAALRQAIAWIKRYLLAKAPFAGRSDQSASGYPMHFLVTWRFRVPDNDKREKASAALSAALKDLSWVRVLQDTYVVQVNSQEQYQSTIDRLVEVAKSSPDVFHMIATPPIVGGRYGGWLPTNIWQAINQRSTQ